MVMKRKQKRISGIFKICQLNLVIKYRIKKNINSHVLQVT